MYARYWQPAGMANYLEEAALYSKDHKSTVSITDSVSNECNCIGICLKEYLSLYSLLLLLFTTFASFHSSGTDCTFSA